MVWRQYQQIEPVIAVTPGVYSFSYLKEKQWKTAEDTEEHLQMVYDPPASFFYNLSFYYHKEPVGKVLAGDPFCYTLRKYATKNAEAVGNKIEMGAVPDEDLANLSNTYAIAVERYQQGALPKEQVVETRNTLVKLKVVDDIKQVQTLIDEIKRRKTYYPPTTTKTYTSLDGAHRIVALSLLLPKNEPIYIWQLTESIPQPEK